MQFHSEKRMKEAALFRNSDNTLSGDYRSGRTVLSRDRLRGDGRAGGDASLSAWPASIGAEASRQWIRTAPGSAIVEAALR